jgi:Glycosyltransferase family 87
LDLRASLSRYSYPRLAVVLLFAGSMWFYVQHVLIPRQMVDATLHGTPRGNLSDLYPRWLGARELLLHNRDPYSQELTREIQMGYYGRALDPARQNDPTDQQGFAYPVYVVFLLAPTIELPFAAVQAGFRWLLFLLIVGSVLLWLRSLHWQPSRASTIALVALTLGSFPVLQGIKLQQLSLFVAGLIAAAIALLIDKHFLYACILLALGTIKPQLVLPVAAWLLVWAISDRRRWSFFWGFIATAAVLCGAGEFVLPGWVWHFREAIAAYRQYNDGAESILEILLTPIWGRVLTALAVLGLSVVWWQFRRSANDSIAFRWVTVLTLAVTVVIVPKAAPYNQVLLLPGILFAIHEWNIIWAQNLPTRIIAAFSVLLISWPWLGAACLTIAAALLPAHTVQQAWAIPLYTSVFIPFAVVVLVAAAHRQCADTDPIRNPALLSQ